MKKLVQIGFGLLLFTISALEAQERPPNIVLFLVDDLGWRDLGCMGSKFYETPHVDRLAAEGVLFTDAYANAPNCAPSRASLLTGLYTPRHGIYTVASPERGQAAYRKLIPTPNKTELASSFRTLAEALKPQGYRSAHMGKWHLGEGPTGPENQGFDINIGGFTAGHPASYFSPYQNPALPDGPEGEYLTDRLTDEALAFIEDSREEPFFLYLSHYAVHTPIQGKEAMTKTYRDKPPHNGQDNAAYAAMIESTDESMGRIMGKLEELGLTENTIVIFFSDNGGHGGTTSNKPLKGAKGMLYEGGIRVPLIIRWPAKAPAGLEREVPVIGTDLYPTLLEAAGLDTQSRKLDGRSLLPLFQENFQWETRPIYWHFPAYLQGYRGTKYPEDLVRGWRAVPSGAIRQGAWKLIEDFETHRVELYHLENDLQEEHNLAGQYPGKVAELLQNLQAWRENVGAPVPEELNPAYQPE